MVPKTFLARNLALLAKMAASTASKSAITLKGSVEIVSEFFGAAWPSPPARLRAPSAAPGRSGRAGDAVLASLAGYSINSILYQRGIYPPETFKRMNKYGLTMMMTADDGLVQRPE